MLERLKITALFFGFIITSVSLFFNYFLSSKIKELQKGTKVLGVLDGDTIVTDSKTRLRLRLIDAPELEFCGGKESKEQLEKLVSGKQVRVEEVILDPYGRPMGLIYVDDLLVNLQMAKIGWVTYHGDNALAESQVVKQVVATAKEQKLGLFGLCRSNLPPKEKCLIKGNIDPGNSKRKLYFVPGCVQYNTAIVELDRGEQWFCAEAEASKAGYTKSLRCP